MSFIKKYRSLEVTNNNLPVTSILPAPRITQKSNTMLDGFVNILTKVGTEKDRRTQYTYQANRRLLFQERKERYKAPLTQKVVNSLIDECLKKSIQIDNENSQKIEKAFKDLKIYWNISRAWKEARVHGGAGAFYFINDGNPPELPVQPERVKEIKPAFILNREYIQPYMRNPVNELRPIPWRQFHEVEYYFVNFSGESQIWHNSRVLFFNGIYAGEDSKSDNSGWLESVIDIYNTPLFLYEMIVNTAGTLSDNLIQEVIKLDGLQSELDEDLESDVIKKILMIMSGKSVVNKMLLDKEDEFEYHSANMAGYSVFEALAMNYLAAATGIPKTKLFGISPSSSIGSQSGSYEQDIWFDTVEQAQNNELAPELDKVMSWIKAPLGIPQDELIYWYFRPLKQIDSKTESEIMLNNARTDQIYIDTQVFSPQEVADTRSKGELNATIEIDIETREAISGLPPASDSDII